MADKTMLDRLREKRSNLGAKRTVTIDVPGYDGELGVRYQWKPYEELARRGQALQKVKDPTKRDMLAAADTLIALCDEVVIQAESDPRADEKGWAPLTDEGDDPIKFDEYLADKLGYEATSAREAVFGLFNNDYAVLNQAMTLSVWLQDTTQEVDSDFSGS
jgi:hypothetical protein